MTALLGVFFVPTALLIGLKLARAAQEGRARRRGFITFGGDDAYQARNVRENIHDAAMVARVRLDMSAAEFDALVERVRTNYLPWYEALDRSIEHRPATPFCEPLEIRDHYEEVRLTDAPLLAKIVLFREDRIVVLLGNHIYLGGYQLSQFVQLVFCERVSKGIFPRNRYVPLLTELGVHAFFTHLALRPRRIWSPTFAGERPPSRFYWKLESARVETLSAELGMSSLYVVIALHLQAVMQAMNRKRLRVTLPVSFEAEDSFNTVGGLFLDFDEAPDLATLARDVRRKVRRGRWQASISNHIQRILPTRQLSQTARNTVDLTLTVVPQKTLPKNLLAEEVTDYEFTMDNIDYPVYVMAFLFERHVHSSFMVNTPDFDSHRFVRDHGARAMELTLDRAGRGDQEAAATALASMK